jgi:hypothetical protein
MGIHHGFYDYLFGSSRTIKRQQQRVHGEQDTLAIDSICDGAGGALARRFGEKSRC